MKFTVNGDAFEVDLAHMPMSDALAIEKAWGRRYVEWEQEFFAGSAEAACVLVWLAWKRDGREVALEDILSGAVDFDYSEVLRSIIAAIEVMKAEAKAAEENPTSGASPLTAPDGTATTPSGT